MCSKSPSQRYTKPTMCFLNRLDYIWAFYYRRYTKVDNRLDKQEVDGFWDVYVPVFISRCFTERTLCSRLNRGPPHLPRVCLKLRVFLENTRALRPSLAPLHVPSQLSAFLPR